MPVTVHEVLLRILTELDPTAIDQAVKQLEELIKRGETLHGAITNFVSQYWKDTAASRVRPNASTDTRRCGVE